jgi:hypothetical protein
MPISPRTNEVKINRILNAWRTLAPEKKFAGMSLSEFETEINPSVTTRAQLEVHDDQRTHLINSRESADDHSLEKAAMVVASVNGDPEYGPDSSLYEAMGYTRKSERKSGLHRTKGGNSSSTPTADQ